MKLLFLKMMSSLYKADRLTLLNVTRSMFVSLFEVRRGPEFPEMSGFTLSRTIRKPDTSESNIIGVYSNKRGRQMLVKSLNPKNKTLGYYQLLNEEKVLSVLNLIKVESPVKSPKVHRLTKTEKHMSLVSEFLKGRTLKLLSRKEKLRVLTQCLSYYEDIAQHTQSIAASGVPQRSNIYLAVSFPLFVLVAMIKDIENMRLYLVMARRFYQNFSLSDLISPKYVLAHKDLHSENIIVNSDGVYIIDHEISVLAEPQTDLALIARLYIEELGITKTKVLLQRFIQDEKSYKRFVKLTIYYAIQIMAIKDKNHIEVVQGPHYLKILEKNLIPYLKQLKLKENSGKVISMQNAIRQPSI